MASRSSSYPRPFGRYELIAPIASGGMGEIHLARLRGAANFEKRCVIKTILPHLATEPSFVERFIDEANLVVQLTHGNIVPVFDMGEHDGEYYIAMDFIAGLDLRSLLKAVHPEPLAVPLAVHIAAEVCKGLGYAHRKTDPDGRPLGIIHRDVSPSNILVSRDGEVKIVDFGIAVAASRSSHSVSGRLHGKFAYMSPEQTRGLALDGRSDLFSAGVVLYEMITAVRPFHAESDLEALERVRSFDPAPPSSLQPGIPPTLDRIVLTALAKDRDQRYASADDMLAALLDFAAEERLRLTAVAIAEALDPAFAAAASIPEAPEDRPRRFEDLLDLEADRLLLQAPTPQHRSPVARPATPSFDDLPASQRHTATVSIPATGAVAPTPQRRTEATPVPAAVVAAAEELDSGPLPIQTPPEPVTATESHAVAAAAPPAVATRRSRLWAAVVLVALVAALLVGWQVLDGTDGPTPGPAHETEAVATPATQPASTNPPELEPVPAPPLVEPEPEPPPPRMTFTLHVTPEETGATLTAGAEHGAQQLQGLPPAFEVPRGVRAKVQLRAYEHLPCELALDHAGAEAVQVEAVGCTAALGEEGRVEVVLDAEPARVSADAAEEPSVRPGTPENGGRKRTRGEPASAPKTLRVEVEHLPDPRVQRKDPEGWTTVSAEAVAIPSGRGPVELRVDSASEPNVVPFVWRVDPAKVQSSTRVAFARINVQVLPYTLAPGIQVASARIAINGRTVEKNSHRAVGWWVPANRTVEITLENESDGMRGSKSVHVEAGGADRVQVVQVELAPRP